MDPASAGIAFVGFAASLATLAAVIANSSKTLYNLRNKLKDAPEDSRILIASFKLFEDLLEEIQAQLQEHGDVAGSQRLQKLWVDSEAQMLEDMEGFKVVVDRLDSLLNGPTLSSKRMRFRIRTYFDEDTIAKYQRKMSTHIKTLTLIQSFMSEYVSTYLHILVILH